MTHVNDWGRDDEAPDVPRIDLVAELAESVAAHHARLVRIERERRVERHVWAFLIALALVLAVWL